LFQHIISFDKIQLKPHIAASTAAVALAQTRGKMVYCQYLQRKRMARRAGKRAGR
jgi:hypothetical protein